MSNPIQIWRFEDAPEEYRDLSYHGGDEDWVALVPKEYEYESLVHAFFTRGRLHSNPFGVCDIQLEECLLDTNKSDCSTGDAVTGTAQPPHIASNLRVTAHRQTWVKVNAEVDVGMARIISALNSIEGLQTLQSCQCDQRGEAFIHFWYGSSWEKASRLVFESIIPALENAGIPAMGSVEVFNGSLPTARIGFNAAALEKATAAIEMMAPIVSDCVRSSEYSRGTECKEQAY